MRGSARSTTVSLCAGLATLLALTLFTSLPAVSQPVASAAQAASASPATSAAPEIEHVAAARAVTAKLPSLAVRPRGDRVVLRGRTHTRSARLLVQRARPGSAQWHRVRVARSARHAYRTVVARPAATTRYRVLNRKRGRASFARIVRPRPAAPVPKDACGVRPRKADGSLWSCSFVDNFSGTQLDPDKWVPQTSGYLTGVKGRRFACYTQDNVTVADGRLRLRLQKRTKPFECKGLAADLFTRYAAGSVTTFHRFSQRYGRFEARMRNTAANVPGLHEAFWLWPDAREVSINWPWTGEIDVAETYSSHPNLAIPFLHYSNDFNGSVLTGPDTNTAYCSAARGTWNTYRLQWAPSKIQIFVNDRLCLTNTSGDAAFKEKYILAFTQAIGAKGNEATDKTPMPAFTDVDWVRAWR